MAGLYLPSTSQRMLSSQMRRIGTHNSSDSSNRSQREEAFIIRKDRYEAMSVQNIEYYTQKDGRKILKVILTPTKNFPNGVTYVDACFEDLIRQYTYLVYLIHIYERFFSVDVFYVSLSL